MTKRSAKRPANRPVTRESKPVGTPDATPPLSREFYATDARTLARALLGRTLVRTLLDNADQPLRLSATIVETEAYLGVQDRAAHTFAGRRTPRNEAMYAKPGTLYVYFTYGMHHCMNVVCGSEGEPTAVLLRAAIPRDGLDVMQALRTRPGGRLMKSLDLCRGPGRLCQALNITRSDNFADLVGCASEVPPRVWIEEGSPVADPLVVNTPRIGVDYAGAWARRKLRWAIRGSAWVSGSASGPTKATGETIGG